MPAKKVIFAMFGGVEGHARYALPAREAKNTSSPNRNNQSLSKEHLDVPDIRPLIEPALNGYSHADVIEALSSLLGQAIADSAETREGAAMIAEGIGLAIGQDIIKNWSLVRARRASG